MYVPARFANNDLGKSLELVARYPFATLISIHEGLPFVTHLPLVLEKQEGEAMVLIGHMARANPHSNLLKGQLVYVIFHGPHHYITPKWYAENDVPTWNYAVVHIQGRVRTIEDAAGIESCLKKLSAHVEAGFSDPWAFWIPEDLAAPGVLQKSILGFGIEIESLKAKFKLNQNRSTPDHLGVLSGLKNLGGEMSLAVHDLMEQEFSLFHSEKS